MSQPESITLNGTTYALADLSDDAKKQVLNVQVAETEMVRLQRQIALAQTARNAYVNALAAAVPADTTKKQ